MPFDASKILGVLTFVAVPCLAILAYRGWAKSLRQELPQWRNALGLASPSGPRRLLEIHGGLRRGAGHSAKERGH
jgi:hypothetical protein